jgi:hypothetical protein
LPAGTLYEDALLIQLRELDGPFAGGGDWEGTLVPSLWRLRRDHAPLAGVAATIMRATEGEIVTFTLRAGDYERVFEVEAGGARRVLGWRTSDGDQLGIVATERLPYWELNDPGEETERERIGLDPASAPGMLAP